MSYQSSGVLVTTDEVRDWMGLLAAAVHADGEWVEIVKGQSGWDVVRGGGGGGDVPLSCFGSRCAASPKQCVSVKWRNRWWNIHHSVITFTGVLVCMNQTCENCVCVTGQLLHNRECRFVHRHKTSVKMPLIQIHSIGLRHESQMWYVLIRDPDLHMLTFHLIRRHKGHTALFMELWLYSQREGSWFESWFSGQSGSFTHSKDSKEKRYTVDDGQMDGWKVSCGHSLCWTWITRCK